MISLRRILFLTALLVPALLRAYTPQIRSIDIDVTLTRDGSALITEVWDVCVAQGTEWYLVRSNLGDIRISDLAVSDETGTGFINEGDWNVKRSIDAKRHRCGILRKGSDDCEICWGVGSYGDHIFTVSYRMSNVVKSLSDADMLHLQFISPGLNAPPERARVTIKGEDTPLTSGNSAIWGFGYDGRVDFIDGKLVAASDTPFRKNSSMIVLARFDKGIFSPTSIRSGTFDEIRERAFEDSDYGAFKKSAKRKIGLFALIAATVIGLSVYAEKKLKQKLYTNLFGTPDIKELGYSRDIPFNGDLFESRYVLEKIGWNTAPNAIAGAIILRMVKRGQIAVAEDGRGKTLLAFNSAASGIEELSGPEKELYEMIKEASGSDLILQDKEFSRWSAKHASRVSQWADSLLGEGVSRLSRDNYFDKTSFTAEGQEQCRRVVGLKKFLEEFTLLKERGTKEAVLWHDYIVFAALYGIAEKVAKELRDIDPKVFEEVTGFEYVHMHRMIYISNSMANSITGSIARAQTFTSVRGGGGFSSFGGGGGFSGGGFGGGSR